MADAMVNKLQMQSSRCEANSVDSCIGGIRCKAGLHLLLHVSDKLSVEGAAADDHEGNCILDAA